MRRLIPMILFQCILAIVISCNASSSGVAMGDTVKELDKSIMIVYQDNKNNYWFGSWETGLYRYDGKSILNFTTKDGLCHNKIGSIQEDKEGNLYIHTAAGISKFDGKTFTTLSISGNEWKLQADDLWFAGAQDSAVVYRYDGKVLHRLKFPETAAGVEFNKRFPRSALPFPFSPYDVYTIYKDSKGNLWFGTGCLGVCRYNGETFTWFSEKDLEFDVDRGFGIRSIIEDNDGKFWFSNILHRYHVLQNGNYSKETGIAGSADKNFDKIAIMSMVKDSDDLWMVTYNEGVWRYNGKSVTHYAVKKDEKQITIFSIFKDRQGDLWLGTHENGVYKFNGKTFERFKP